MSRHGSDSDPLVQHLQKYPVFVWKRFALQYDCKKNQKYYLECTCSV